MTPSIVKLPEMVLVGVNAALRSPAGEPYPKKELIQGLWKELTGRQLEIGTLENTSRHAVIKNDLGPATPDPTYGAYFRVSKDIEDRSPPPGLEKIKIPALSYATFRHHGLPQDIGKAAFKLINHWLPQEGYLVSQELELMIYAQGYRPPGPLIPSHDVSQEESSDKADEERSYIDYFIPVAKQD